jgi:hypothetical protein
MSGAEPKNLRIELLHFEGCPGAKKALEVLQEVISAEGLSDEIIPVTYSSADRSDFPGSPTILVEGEDLFPQTSGREAHGCSCRIYTTPDGLQDHPTTTIVREALERRLKGKEPTKTESW